MQRISQLDTASASPDIADTLNGVRAELGMVPNILKTMAQSPAVLEGYLGLSGALANGKFAATLREKIALTVAGENGCDYCASAHSAVGEMLGISPGEIADNLSGHDADAKAQAALDFAREVVVKRGMVSDADLVTIRAVGFSDEDIIEIVGNVAVNLFTNYFNHIAGTEIDFPVVETKQAA